MQAMYQPDLPSDAYSEWIKVKVTKLNNNNNKKNQKLEDQNVLF